MSLDSSDLFILYWLKQHYAKENLKTVIETLEFTRGNFNYHLTHLNNYCVQHNQPELVFDKKTDLKALAHQILQIVELQEQNFFMKSEERLLLAILFLYIKNSATAEDLANYFDISNNTVLNDLILAKQFLTIYSHLQVAIRLENNHYYLTGDEHHIRFVLMNVIITIVNHRNYRVVEMFLVKRAHLLTSKINLQILTSQIFQQILEIVQRHYAEINFIDFEINTIVLFLFVIAISNRPLRLTNYFTNPLLRQFYEQQDIFALCDNLFADIDKLHLGWGCDIAFEKFFLSTLLISVRQNLISIDSDGKKRYMITCENIIHDLIGRGYQVHRHNFICLMTNYLIWFSESISYLAIYDISRDYKRKIIEAKPIYKTFFRDLSQILKQCLLNYPGYNMMWDNKFPDLCIQLIVTIQKFPGDVNGEYQMVFISDVKGGLIDTYKLYLHEMYPQIDHIEVVSYWYYQQHHLRYTDYFKTSNLEIFRNSKIITYLDFKKR